ncbi:hypothetical protein CPB85DRAFT_1345261 [Mucidula mucida]|nr:hypothetical protein CPB85DRAFT_1345261 [Mucidula mucida]
MAHDWDNSPNTRRVLLDFLDAEIAQDYDSSVPPDPHPTKTATSWPNGPDAAFPWMDLDSSSASQILDIGEGCTVELSRTLAAIKMPGALDTYGWAIHRLDLADDGTLEEHSYALADIYFRVKNIKDLLGVASKDELTLWVLMLLRISVNEEQEIEAKCEPRLVPKEGSFAEGQVRQKYVIKYDGMRNHPSEQELKW